MTTGLKSSHARIHAANASPEQSFAAIMIASAAEAARAGDCIAYAWLESPCSLRWIVAVTPAGDDCERIQAALLETIPAPVCEPSTSGYPMSTGKPYDASKLFETEWGERMNQRPETVPSETAVYCVQLEMNLEAT